VVSASAVVVALQCKVDQDKDNLKVKAQAKVDKADPKDKGIMVPTDSVVVV
jgi:hypothetical protein